jgi:hypothetical protein
VIKPPPGSKPLEDCPQPAIRKVSRRLYIKTKTPVTANKVEVDTGFFIPRKSGQLFKTMEVRRTGYFKGCLQTKDLCEFSLEPFQADDGRVTL